MPLVAIVGGGIGGAALAASLLQRGIEVKLFEKAPAFGEIGAGVQMTPNAVKVIRALGCGDRLLKVGFMPEAVVGRNWRSGRENFRIHLGGEFPEFYGAPYVQIHRADLLDLFISAIPDSIAQFSKTCVGVSHFNGGAAVHFSDGTSAEADLVIGADGVRSAVRTALFGDQPLRYTGHMCFRALVPVDGPVDFVDPHNTMWMGANSHVVTYYVKAGRAVNIVAVAESPAWVEEGWNVRSSKSELLGRFEGWHPRVTKLFSHVDEVYRWGLFDRDPMPAWSKGHVSLLGDAAHPMLPFLSQGAAMAIEDGYILATLLQKAPNDIPGVLARYEAERRPRTSRVQLESRKRGQTYHLPSFWAQKRRDLEYRLRSIFAPRTTGIRADWVYEYDATRFAADLPS